MSGRKENQSSYINFSTGHDDLVHDVAYDFYGRRMATVSSDQRLKVFDLNDEGEWVISESFRAHDAIINRVIWGPPEHGQIIATCSYDRLVRIWEEQEMEPKGSNLRWKRQFEMRAETHSAVYDISFPPTSAYSVSGTSTGLKIGFISTDGVIQIYECREPQDLTHWIAVDVFHTLTAPPAKENEVAFCLDFCPSRWGGEQLVVGIMDKAQVYRQSKAGKFRPAEELKGHRGLVRDVSWAAGMGRSYHLIATACKDGHVRIFKLTTNAGSLAAPKSRYPTGGGRRPRPAGASAGLGAGLAGGADDMISAAEGEDAAGGAEDERWLVDLIGDFDDHHSDVWRVAWNATGTVLSSAGDDGNIRLWKAAISGEFQCLSVIASHRSGWEEQEVTFDD
ncbi:WD40 repeat-like protein [Morchella conica CCBAS932]|uniref:WD40 repeat-like protein n=1 Tax=Morchella conica CCBAS932 TaxID=1392247 RepID=A0A3N4KTD5_9PEZI|nr:WD40 repeat-like protein [Morchella conica CCBAS932]